MTAFIPYQVHSAEILQASAGKYNVLFFFKAKGIITVMTLGLKKPEIDCKNHKTIVYLFTLDTTFLSKSKAWLHNIALQIEKKIMNHTKL